jgi:hypothetical protein
MQPLRQGFGTFASVASQAEYALPANIARITRIRETTNDRTLAARSLDWWRAAYPDPAANTGTPDSWAPIGRRALYKRPSATGVWAVSSAAGDTTQGVLMTGTLSTSDPRGAASSSTTTLTGTTRVRLGGTNTFDDVLELSLNAATTGTITFYDAAASGNVLGSIPAGRRVARLYAFVLAATPSSAIDYSVDYEHAITDLSNTWDEPVFHEDYHDILLDAALMLEFEGRDDSRYAAAKGRYDERFRDLKAYIANHRSGLQATAPREIAPLGPWYPRQGW